MERFENWMSYSYDGVEYGRKQVDTCRKECYNSFVGAEMFQPVK